MVDEELHDTIHRAKQGDQEAFAALITRYKGHVYRYAFGMLGNRMDAEDAAQEAFIKAYYALAKLDNEYAFSSWIIRIVANVCKDRLGKRAKINELESMEEQDEAKVADMRAPDTLEQLTLAEGLSRLSAEHREILVLHEIQGYSYEEIAVIIEVPVGTVKSRLHAARMGLRRELRRED
ncbi:RNA polymerase sigma-70 factor (ECF subfamily) [Paenibacillus taihuensis]|uniref:RNA polymerase sigma-70 factor (ECF subfamily) n=1 Tax=Paenibacillus taihuensis TaxID=1156355 RepID=A0A3D9SN31_9BACL|nr:RNA polymerase sigma-70 factor (ECF subfamily) [Paenibacillus taihuensis]